MQLKGWETIQVLSRGNKTLLDNQQSNFSVEELIISTLAFTKR